MSIRKGRFRHPVDAAMRAINSALGFDKRLYAHDIKGSLAHVAMLGQCGIVAKADVAAIERGLREVEGEIARGEFVYDDGMEDIHMAVEARLGELITPEVAGRLHTARSRNDQTVTALRLYTRDVSDAMDGWLHIYQHALATRALEHAHTLMPGFTHLQPAQPVSLGHHLLAYVEMAQRDRARLADARVRVNVMPLGAAALAGTSFPIKPEITAEILGFAMPATNSLDAVSDRDFVAEVMFALALAGVHLSRLGEEFVVWATPAFGFISFSDAFSTGSSIMPQKRNPDAAELLRAKAARMLGGLTGMLALLKNLPLAYNKDTQEDKPFLFDAVDTMALALPAAAGMVLDMKPNAEAMARMTDKGGIGATDLADMLVREHGMPFREAHRVVGALAARAEDEGVEMHRLDVAVLQEVDERLDAAALEVLEPRRALAARTSPGGTAPIQVEQAARGWLAALEPVPEPPVPVGLGE